MKAKQSLLMFLIVVLGTTSTLGQPIISPSCFSDSHDITSLQAWGPYSKLLCRNLPHSPNMQAGMRFDFSVMPGYYRNRQLVPHVLFESSYYPWISIHP